MIIFKKITIQNFLSIGNVPLSMELNKHQLTMIAGKNGQGKTTWLDALCFGLYNKAYRNINKPGLINSINGKNCLIAIEFSIGKKQYKVLRGMKPNVFEIYQDGEMINQDPSIKDYQKVLEQQILKMNYRAFTQLVIIGSTAYIPFMKLTPAARREFVEDLLDIRIFSAMSNQLKEEIRTLKDDIKTNGHEMKSVREKFELQKDFIEKQKRERVESTKSIELEIEAYEKENEKLQVQIDELIDKIDAVTKDCDKYDKVEDDLSALKHTKKTVMSSIDKLTKEGQFYQNIDECPQCKQGISHDHKSTIITNVEKTLENLHEEFSQIEKEIEKTSKKYEALTKKLEEQRQLNKDLSNKNHDIATNNAVIRSKKKQIEAVKNDTTSIDEEKKKLKEYAKTVVTLDNQRREFNELNQYQQAAQIMLQDSGIKAKVIKQYIPVINKMVNKYLDSLDFFCQFTLDENFNEIVKSRYRDNFVYDSFSEGEKLRINISLLLTWIHIAEAKNQASCNLLFADEILDGALDHGGADLMLGLFRTLKNKNLFLISHRDLNENHFDHSIKFEKVNNFTEIITS
jgi:DNA repair exonuclease SbcCD ATPase subunit